MKDKKQKQKTGLPESGKYLKKKNYLKSANAVELLVLCMLPPPPHCKA